MEAKAGWEPSWLFVTFQFLYIINEPAESGENDIPGGMNGNGSRSEERRVGKEC